MKWTNTLLVGGFGSLPTIYQKYTKTRLLLILFVLAYNCTVRQFMSATDCHLMAEMLNSCWYFFFVFINVQQMRNVKYKMNFRAMNWTFKCSLKFIISLCNTHYWQNFLSIINEKSISTESRMINSSEYVYKPFIGRW